jgi:hypothetical protein
MLQVATRDMQEGMLFLPILRSYRTVDTEPDTQLSIRGPQYSLPPSILLSQYIISTDILLPTQEVSNESVSVRDNGIAIPMNDSSLLGQEYDLVVNMPPRGKYTITLKVESVGRAHPNIVEPDWC